MWSPPPGTTAEPGATITSAMWNALKDDIETELNLPLPFSRGGVGGTSKATAQSLLGTVPQDSTSDSTAGRLMLNGAWGLGGQVPIDVPSDDCNLITRTGWYRGVADTTLNMPESAGTFEITHIARTANSGNQLAYQIGAAKVYSRFNNAGTWSAWRLVDIITDSGNNANGYYVKYASGKIECRHGVTFSAAIGTAYLGGFRCTERTWTFPTSFDDGGGNPHVFVSPGLLSGFSAVRTSATTATQAFYAVTAISSQSAADRTVSLLAVRF